MIRKSKRELAADLDDLEADEELTLADLYRDDEDAPEREGDADA